MINSPIHLTEGQQKDLQSIARSLCDRFQIESIICFATQISINEKNCCFIDITKEFERKYYLLVILKESTNTDNNIQVVTRKQHPGTFILPVSLKAFVNGLKHNNTFFLNVYINGNVVFTSGRAFDKGYGLFTKLDLAHVNDIKAFEHQYCLAYSFLESAYECYERCTYGYTLFMLHQAVEYGCCALIWRYTGFRLNSHSLTRLLEFCGCFSAEPEILFRRHFDDEKRLFNKLANSYREIRYENNFEVTDRDADELCTLVKAFLDLVSALSLKEPHKGNCQAAARIKGSRA